MCGITCYWARESSPSLKTISDLLSFGEKRGTDGFGIVKYTVEGKKASSTVFTKMPDYDKVSNSLDLKHGELFISNHRAAPETESPVDENNPLLTLQPIVNTQYGILLSHNGSVSNKIVRALKKRFSFNTKIDSEAIIWEYLNQGKNLPETMKVLSGGFSFVMMDVMKNKLYSVCTHNPLYYGYVRGSGLIISSVEDAVYKTISNLKNVEINRCTMNIWEDYYCNQVKENCIMEIDIDSGMMNEFCFEPRYITSTYDTHFNTITNKWKDKPITLVAASGGLDSSTTLAIMKDSGLNPVAVHFKYGHRGQEAEEIAVKKVCEILDVPVQIFDIEENMRHLDCGMLTDKDAKVITGTEDEMKTTGAWTVFRNHLFMTYMGALAESLIMVDNYKEVYLTGGFMNLSESGGYPDNSERFIQSAIKFFQFSVTGTRIKPIYGLCNILKTEQYFLLNKLGYLNLLSPWLISCDRPIVEDGIVKNCSKDGKPACGSGLLSYWACIKAGYEDKRNYYQVDDPEYKAYEPDNDFSKPVEFDLEKIISKLEIPVENKNVLIGRIKE